MTGRTRLAGVAVALGLGLACVPTLPEVDDPCATWPEPGLYRLPMDGFDRRPFVVVPDTAGPRPAVVMLHGAGGDANKMMYTVTRLLDLAEDGAFVAVFPNGSGTPETYTWNAGTCCGPAKAINADDVAFLDAIRTNLERRVCVDRVVAAGHSNGAMMAVRWACEGTNPPSAVLSSAGATLVDTCADGEPVPITLSHGLDDPRVPYDGGYAEVEQAGFEWPSVEASVAPFLDRNGCDPESARDTVVGDTTCTTWSCAVPTRSCAIAGFGHGWPGGPRGEPTGFDAEDEILALVDETEAPLDGADADAKGGE